MGNTSTSRQNSYHKQKEPDLTIDVSSTNQEKDIEIEKKKKINKRE
jgi:hypothetical protein